MGDLNFILYTLMCFVDFMLQHKCFYIQQRKMHNKAFLFRQQGKDNIKFEEEIRCLTNFFCIYCLVL